MNEQNATKHAEELLISMGLDLTDNNYKETPKRLVEVLSEFTYALKPIANDEINKLFSVSFPCHNDTKTKYSGMLVQSPIRVYSLCSHHLLPIIYDISFAYIPNTNNNNGNYQIGFSKITRILRILAKRPMNQEDFTQTICEVFDNKLKPKGLAIIVSGIHLCMKMRGACSEATNITSTVRGDFKNYERSRDEFLTLALNYKNKKW